MTYHVRLMRRDDVTQVAEIDCEAFPSAWPAANFTHELENLLAHYLVVESDNDTDAVVPSKVTDSVSGVRRLFNYRLFGRKVSPPASRYVVGFVGFWIMADEAHITSIAVRTSHRCRGIGELLLISAIELAAELNARMVTLEVRVSNLSAQSLYYKFGFAQVGLRRRYYTDNGEDAFIMSTENVASPSFQARFAQLKQDHARKRGLVLAEYQISR